MFAIVLFFLAIVDFPSLAGLKARLDGALSTLGWWEMSLPMAGGLEPGDLQGPFQPKPLCDSMIFHLRGRFLPRSRVMHPPFGWGLRGGSRAANRAEGLMREGTQAQRAPPEPRLGPPLCSVAAHPGRLLTVLETPPDWAGEKGLRLVSFFHF